MKFEDALRIADEAVMRLKGQHLNDAQRVVLRGSWDGLSYEKIAEGSEGRFGERYLGQDVGAKLWKLLSDSLGEKVSKNTFRTAFEIRSSQNGSAISEPSVVRSPSSSLQFDFVAVDTLASPPSAASLRTSPNSHQNWNELLIDVSNFYGRSGELSELETWIVEKHCRLVVLSGMKGIGKTLLSQKLRTQVQAQFTQTICLSLRHSPSPTELLGKLLQSLTDLQENIPSTLDGRLSYLIQHFHQSACLVVLDDTEAVFQEKTLAGCYRSGYEDYEQVLKRVAETLHHSCLIWVGQEEPEDLARLKGHGARSMLLPGLSADEGQGMLQSRCDSLNPEIDWSSLVKRCDGNPLVLLVACDDIEIFSEEIEEYWAETVGRVREQFDEQFDRLSSEEMQVMYWLAIAQEPITLTHLQSNMIASQFSVSRIIQSLKRRALCFQIQPSPAGMYRFTQSQIVMEYLLQQFLQRLMEEVQTENVMLLSSHTLFMAQAPEHIREKQLRYILKPFVERIRYAYPSVEGVDQQMKRLLSRIRSQAGDRTGYAAGNLINLCQQLNLDLTDGYDFSGLTIRQADLWNVNLNNSNFVCAELSQSTFASPLGSSIVLAFSPDGKLLATGDEDGRVLLWQVASGRLGLICQNQDNSSIRSLAFNPSGDVLAGASEDQRIKLWNVRTGHQWGDLSGHGEPFQYVCFSPDRRTLASGSHRTIHLWDIYSRRCLQTLDDHQEEVTALCFNPNGELLASCGNDQTVHLWEVSSGERLQSLPNSTNSWFKTVLFQPIDTSESDSASANTAIAAELDDGAIKLWRVESGEFYGSFLLDQTRDRAEVAVAIAFSVDGQRMASGIMVTELENSGASRDSHIVKVWDVQTKTLIQTLEGFSSQVHALAFSCDGQLLAASGDRQLRLWSVSSGQCLRAMQDCREPACSFTFSHDSTRLVVGNRDHTIRLWDLHSGRRCQTLLGHTDWVEVVAASPDGKWLASSSSYDKTVRLWNAQTSDHLRILGEHDERIRVVCFSPNGRWLASGSNDQTVKLWDVSTGACLVTFAGHGNQIYSLCFSPNGKLLASGSFDCTIRLWDVKNKQQVGLFEGHEGRIHTLSFRSDGQKLMSGSHDESVRIWEVATGSCQNVWQRITERVNAVVFNGTNRAIASISDITSTNVIQVWDVYSNNLIQTLEWDQPSKVWQVYFSLDGKFLVSGTHNGVIRVWCLRTGMCLRALRVASPYEGMNIRDAQGLSEPQKVMLADLGAIER